MRRRIERLYHLAEADNLASILNHGLMSTERLIRLAEISEPASTTLLRTHRPDNVRLRMGGDPGSATDAAGRSRRCAGGWL